jgi:hypothetical protein
VFSDALHCPPLVPANHNHELNRIFHSAQSAANQQQKLTHWLLSRAPLVFGPNHMFQRRDPTGHLAMRHRKQRLRGLPERRARGKIRIRNK